MRNNVIVICKFKPAVDDACNDLFATCTGFYSNTVHAIYCLHYKRIIDNNLMVDLTTCGGATRRER